jgi:hypothetical protein
LEARLSSLNRTAAEIGEPPTREWVEAKVRTRGDALRAGGPDAAHALRHLVGGVIKVTEAEGSRRKRKFLVGTFTLTARAIPDVLSGAQARSNETGTRTESVQIEFRDEPPWAAVADSVKAAFDRGLDYQGIAESVGCPYPWVAKALAWWHQRRGLAIPDGRSLKSRLDRPPLAASLADGAKALWDRDVPMQDIALKLNCNRDTVTAAIAHWFATRGLAIPDGRNRRKEVRLRTEE